MALLNLFKFLSPFIPQTKIESAKVNEQFSKIADSMDTVAAALDRTPVYPAGTAFPSTANAGKALVLDAGGNPAFKQLGTAADLTATTSNTDSTAGRALRVGNFGVGSNAAPQITDANTLDASGLYWVAATWAGSPFSGTDGANQGYLLHEAWSTSLYAKQTFVSVNNQFMMKIRRKDNGTWSRWFDVAEMALSSGDMRAVPRFDVMAGMNADNIITPGWFKNPIDYNSSSNMPVIPVGGTPYWFLEVLKYDGGNMIIQRAHNYQFVTGGYSTPYYTFERVYNGTEWSKWRPITFPQVGQVYYDAASAQNVGAVIERGVNANGEYMKLADGHLVCKLQYNETVDITTAEGALFRNASGITWNFPAQFVDYPVVTGQFPTCGAWLTQRANGIVSCIYYWQAALNFSADGYAQIMAIGRWR